jgi:beta-galactosidase GanA
MLLRPSICAALLWLLATLPAVSQSQHPSPISHLEKRGDTTQLIVDGKPFLALGGELYNNSATSLEYMKPVWPRLAAAHLNTVLVPISWALLEPTEGKFDFSLVDGLMRGARAQNLRIVFLWFGSWKNTWSSYMPDWVKRDFVRFARVQLANGSGTERLSPLSEANRDADARAFAALMRRVKEVDSDAHTVIMIQVENEVGVIPDARDHSPAADAAYNQPVPAPLMEYLWRHKESLDPDLRARWQRAGLKTSGNWEAVFGSGPETEDFFMAWQYARYIGKVAEAGKAEYALPMFANAALIRPNYAPGQYNSGGPLPHSMDIWKAGAPQLDFAAPDIYFEFKNWCAKYDRPGNPLFIPEAAGDAQGAANVFYAVGHHRAFGFSPFAIDGMESWGDGGKELARSYEVLSQLAPLILENQPKGNVEGVLLEELTPSQRIRLGDYTLNVSPGGPRRIFPGEPASPEAPRAQSPHGVFIASAPDEFYLAGSGLTVTFSANTPGPPIVGLATVEEGRFVDGRWMKGRTLAGDDTGQGNSVSLRGGPGAGVVRVILYRYR